MNAKLLALAVASLIGISASADVLYWQVNNTDIDASTKSAYSYAILRATDSNPASATAANQYYVSQNLGASGANLGPAIARSVFDNGYVGGVMENSAILSTANATAYTGELSALSFFLELYDASGNWVGETTSIKSYQQLVDSGTISGFNANFKGVNAAMGSTGGYRDVPEPTSGLLMLVGLGALALRRRKVA